MLKFINKNGQNVLEIKDNGDLTYVSEELKVTGLVEKQEEEKDGE